MSSCAEQGRLLVASSLLSSRWSRDNLVTPDPARLYTGAIEERIGVARLEELVSELMGRWGSFDVVTGGLGVLSWTLKCRSATGDFLLQLPLSRDGLGVGGRSKWAVPKLCLDHARHFARQGLGRYLLPAKQLLDLSGGVQAACFELPRGPVPFSMGLGAARVDLEDTAGSWVLPLGGAATTSIRRELMTVLSYYYDPEAAGGTAVSDVLINDGDFLVQRDSAGKFSLKLVCARRLEQGIDPNRFLCFLVQLIAYEDWQVGDDLVGLPVPVGEPAVAFWGFERGIAQRYADLGLGEELGRELARGWIQSFGCSREGRAYRPWVDRFLAGTLTHDTRDDPRCPWWNLVELEQRRDLARLKNAERAAVLSELVQRLEAVVGVGGCGGSPGVNDLSVNEVSGLLERCGVEPTAKPQALEAWFAGWPYRNRRQLEDQVEVLRSRSKLLRTLRFAGALPARDEGTPKALERLPNERAPRVLANPELFGEIELHGELAARAVACFPSFEAFMDDVLHEPRWGYYQSRVSIGVGGHFSTNPEALTPHYGRWIAAWALEVWSELLSSGRLRETDSFSLIEFGAGNGRLARDVLDAVKSARGPRWLAFGKALDYRIYELSDTLREKQQRLLEGEARVLPGDARRPDEALRRDFPAGVTGLVVSNELPDAFGVHKLMLSSSGAARAVLVVPRIEADSAGGLGESLADLCRTTDARLRALFGWRQHAGHWLLDRASFGEVMTFAYQLPTAQAHALIDQIWFEELRVPATCFESLGQLLDRSADQYARALAREDSGVVQYVNVHADNYVRGLASVLRAGQIMTIDYGDTTWGLIHGARRGKFPFRIYCDEGDFHPRPNHPYTRPGGQDLTADINFTDLALAGLSAELDLVYFGPERAVVAGELGQVLASTDQQPFAKFVGNSVFKLLVLGRDSSYHPPAVGLEALPLFAEEAWLDSPLRARASSIASCLRASTEEPSTEEPSAAP